MRKGWAHPGVFLAAGALAVSLLGAPLGAVAADPPTASKQAAKVKRGPRGPRGFRGPTGSRGRVGSWGRRPGRAAGRSGRHRRPRPGRSGLRHLGFSRTPSAPPASGGEGSIAIGADGLALITIRRHKSHPRPAGRPIARSSIARSRLTRSSYRAVAEVGGLLQLDDDQRGRSRPHRLQRADRELKTCALWEPGLFASHHGDDRLRPRFGSRALDDDRSRRPRFDQLHRQFGGAVKIAHCQNLACSSATLTTVGPASEPGLVVTTSVTIAGDGLGLSATTADLGVGLKIAHCADVACSSTTSRVVDGRIRSGEAHVRHRRQ